MPDAETLHDVVVVGAGLAGLSASLALQNQNLDVVVLEAQDRVGGRTLSQKDAEFGTLELGGRNIPPFHHQLINLARELGVDTFMPGPDRKIQRKIWFQNNTPLIYSGHYPRFWNPFINLDFNNAIRSLNQLMTKISVEEPWTSPDADYLDSVSVKDWVQRTVWTRTVASFFVYACKTDLTIADPSKCSMLYFLWFLKQFTGLIGFFPSAKDIKAARSEINFKGGAQQVCINAASKLGNQCVHLNTPVTSIRQTDDTVIVSTQDGREFRAKYAVISTSPAVYQNMNFDPLLPNNRLAALDAMTKSTGRIKSWLGFTGKLTKNADSVEVLFVNADKDCPIINGIHLGDSSLIECVSDASVDGFGNLTTAERKNVLCKYFQKIFGTDVEVSKYLEKDWVTDEYTMGCSIGTLPPGILTKYKHEYKKPFGRIYFAGTDMAHKWKGQMGGAVLSGQATATKILHNLGLISANAIEEEPFTLDVDVLPPYYLNPIIRYSAPSVGTALTLSLAGTLILAVIGGLWIYS